MNIIIGCLVFMTALSALRILIGPSIWDRLLGLNLVTSKLIMVIILIATLRSENFLLDFAFVYAMLSFIGIIFIAIYLQRKGRY